MATYGKGRADFYQSGGWNVVCYECGRKRKAAQMRRHWEGYWVCPEHWEPRQPQDFVRGMQDEQTPPWTQPMPADTFVPFNWGEYPVEQLTLLENFARVFHATRSFSDAISITESVQTIQGRPFSDSFTVSDSSFKRLNKTFNETVLVSDSVSLNNLDQLVESVPVMESNSRTFVKNVSETVTVTESFTTPIFSSHALNGAALNALALGG